MHWVYVLRDDNDGSIYVGETKRLYRRWHESNSGRPIRPNFNRDKLTDELTRLQKELQIPVSELMERLERLNETYKNTKDRSKLSVNIQVKCGLSDLWLFAWSSTIATTELKS
jgi:predicted GIY-YIG superfamily endonuclease